MGGQSQGSRLCPGRGGMLPFQGRARRRSPALIPAVKIIWMLSPENHFSSENCLSSQSASVSNIFEFCWWECFWEYCSFAGIFFQRRVLHFTMTREDKWPSTQHPALQSLPHTGAEPDASLHPALIGVGAGSLQSPAKAPRIGLLNNW